MLRYCARSMTRSCLRRDRTMITTLISQELGLKLDAVSLIARSASYRYKDYTVPKRTGGAARLISQPTAQVKVLQIWLVRKIFRLLPIHAAAAAYMRHCSIARHAALHSRNNFLLKVDFRDFFPSLKGEDILQLLQENRGRLPYTCRLDGPQPLQRRPAPRLATVSRLDAFRQTEQR